MDIALNFHIDVKQITIAHEFTLDGAHRCEYSSGRGSYGLVFAIDGEAEYRFVTGERISARRADVLFISPDSAYRIITKKPFRHYTVNFDIHKKNSSFKAITTAPGVMRLENAERLELIFKRLVNTWSSKNTSYEMLSVGILYELLSELYTAHLGSKDKSTERILASREYIERHFNEDISLATLARLSDMSITNFRREWAKNFHETAIRYRDSLRLHYAKEYLRSRYYTVCEVASKCGFNDVNYFVRFFKKHTGVSPGKF